MSDDQVDQVDKPAPANWITGGRKYFVTKAALVAVVFFALEIRVSANVNLALGMIEPAEWTAAGELALEFAKWGLGAVLLIFVGGNVVGKKLETGKE